MTFALRHKIRDIIFENVCSFTIQNIEKATDEIIKAVTDLTEQMIPKKKIQTVESVYRLTHCLEGLTEQEINGFNFCRQQVIDKRKELLL